MIPSPLENVESLRIGTVDFVSPNEIRVSLDIEAPESLSLNAGTPRPFPRINSYVLIPSDEGYLVGQVEWLTVEPSPYPKRRGMMDFGLVDLPYPLRKLSLNPVGTLRKKPDGDGNEKFEFQRGVESFPSVGDNVLIPTQAQLHSIVESGEKGRVKIGTSVLAGNADVCVDPDRLFGRHLAVLGNTGSGKSCSVAGLIRWSLEAASNNDAVPNARFIVLDPNGEYERAFGSETGILKPRIFRVDPKQDVKLLQVPLWFWDSCEWSSFTQASGKAQRPLLRRALREVKTGCNGVPNEGPEEKKLGLRRYVLSKLVSMRCHLINGTIQTESRKFGLQLKTIMEDLRHRAVEFPDIQQKLEAVIRSIEAALAARYKPFPGKDGKQVENYEPFTEAIVIEIIDSMGHLLGELGGIVYADGPSEDMPVRFLGTDLCDHLSLLSEEEAVTQYLDFLIIRIRSLISDTRMKSIICDEESPVTLDKWLSEYIGGNQEETGCLTIIDLSLVPSEIVHIVTAVIARMIFESLQRYRKQHDEHKVLPTVLVMEEAHNFVRWYKDDMENQDVASVCCKVFERIAREGRKFGLGLVLSSQRPSELSPTVLSQCNTFLLHRISNDRDQDLVHRYVPDNLRGLLRDLPVLPSQDAILLGWASELPIIVHMNDLPKDQQPQSDDPDFWNVWTGEAEREVNWKQIADIWQGKANNDPVGE